MNDPGLDEPAQEAAHDVERNVYEEGQEEQEEREQHDFLDPSRWWFFSTASPLIAGTFGPIANAFSICALVEKWRVYIPPGKDEGHGTKITDPKWLIAINSISLALALTANSSLLLNMARRVSFAIAQPITIIGWYLSSFLLIALVAAASTSGFRLQPRQEHALSQAYYYGIIAAALYFIIASLMVLSVYGAHTGHYKKEFQLTPPQRTLMLQTISFMFYLLLGALVFSTVEDWTFLDAVYWADFTLLTVGIGGEFVPMTHTGRSLLFPYAIGGLVMVGLVIGSVRSLVLENGKRKMSARFMETKRQKVASSIDAETKMVKLGPLEKIKFSQKGLSEAQRREQEFLVMRRVQKVSERNRRYTGLAMSTTAALLLWFLGALVFKFSEKQQGWSYFVSLYFAYTSLLTIGYGDYTISSNAGKAFFVFWSLLAVPTLTIFISHMGDTVIKTFKDLTIFIGSITLLPGEQGLTDTIRLGLRRMKFGEITGNDLEEGNTGLSEKRTMDRLAEHIEASELNEAKEASEHGDSLERDIHFYHYVLAKEIRQLMEEVDITPPKEYSYHEWSYYLRLIGQDENDASIHKSPRKLWTHRDSAARQLGMADNGKDLEWSWLGIRSPLMGSTSEAQWLLQRLSATLESELQKLGSSRAKRRKDPPPISMADYSRSKDGKDTHTQSRSC